MIIVLSNISQNNNLMKTIHPPLSILCCLCFSLFISCGEGKKNTTIPFQEKSGGKWGLIDVAGNILIEPEFEYQIDFASEGVSKINYGRDEGVDFIKISEDKAFEYANLFLADALPFSEGLAAIVPPNSKIAFINTKFETVFTLENIEYSGSFSNGLAPVQNTEGRWGFVNKIGELSIPCVYAFVSSFFNNTAIAIRRSEDLDDYSIILINEKGEVIHDYKNKYKNCGQFKEGLLAVNDGDGWGFVNSEGEKIIPIKETWSNVTSFHNGHASYREDGEWGLINKKGEKVIRPKYSNPLIFDNGLAPYYERREGYGFINLKGEKTISAQFDDIAFAFTNKNAIVKDGNYYIFIDNKGKSINNNEYRNVAPDQRIGKKKKKALYYPMLASNDLEFEKVRSQFLDVDAIINQTLGDLNKYQEHSKDIVSMLNTLGFEINLEKGVSSSGSYFYANQYSPKYIINSNGESVEINNVGRNSIYVYFDKKVKKPVRNEYGYISRYNVNLTEEGNGVKEIRFKLKLSDKAYNKQEFVATSIAEKLLEMGYNEITAPAAGSARNFFQINESSGEEVLKAKLATSSHRVTLSLYFKN